MTATLAERFDELHRDFVDEVERQARAILRRHRSLDQFVMAMGSAFFTRTADTVNVEDLPGAAGLAAFLREWDQYLRLTGTPMRFTARGPKVTDW